jgi:CelD/BcsL family acetyltransferase involved in cellulose biosynthesis
MVALREEWSALAAQMQHPLLDHDWFCSCAEALSPEAALRVTVARDGGTVTGIAPMVLEPTPSGARLGLLGASTLHEPSGWLFASAKAVEELIEPVLRGGHPVMLQRVPTESGLCSILPSLSRRRALSVVWATAPSRSVVTSGPWDAYYEGLSSRITENLARLRRRAAREVGPVAFTMVSPASSGVDGLLDAFAQVEASGWKGRGGSALRQRPRLLDFFRRYGRRSADRGRLRVSTLSFGTRTAAMEIAVEAYGRWWQLKIGFEEGVARYYPGLQLAEASIRAAFDRGLASYEFLGSAESWEDGWRPETRRYNLLALYPYSAGGLTGACRDVAHAAWNRVRPWMAGGAG